MYYIKGIAQQPQQLQSGVALNPTNDMSTPDTLLSTPRPVITGRLSSIDAISLRKDPGRIPNPSHRHAAPSAPWPWLDLNDGQLAVSP